MEAVRGTFTQEWIGDGTVVSARGPIDRSAVARLHAPLDDAVRNTEGEVTVDLSGVSFLDAAALQLLLLTSRRLSRQGRRLSTVCPRGPSLTLIERSGFYELFTIYPTLGATLGAQRSRRWETRATRLVGRRRYPYRPFNRATTDRLGARPLRQASPRGPGRGKRPRTR